MLATRNENEEHGKHGIELLGAEEVSELLGVKESTVWRWCREGSLPCLKVGRNWRVRRDALEDFLLGKEQPSTLVGQLGSFLRMPDNVLAIAQNLGLLHWLDAAFFRVGEARGGFLVKFYGGEDGSEEELVARLEDNGLEAGRLLREGRLLMRPEVDPSSDTAGQREGQLGRLIGEGVSGGRTVWASFDWARRIAPEAALEQQRRLAELLGTHQGVVKTAVLEEAAEGWSVAFLRRAQSAHFGTIFAGEDNLFMGRAASMPSS